MNLNEADSILAHERELEEAREVKAQADRVAAEERRKASLAKQRERERAERESVRDAATTAKDAFKDITHDALARCDGLGVLAMLDRIILGAERGLALLDGDQARVKELQRRRAELPSDLRDHVRNLS